LTQLGGRVRFASGRIGVIGIEKLEPNEYPKLEKMYIDIGAKDKAEAETLVSVGDAAGFWRDCVLQGNRVVAKAMDDRIACAVLVQTLKELTATPNEVYFVFTVQEEVGLRGAITSAYGLEPDVAIAVDVTLTGDTPEARTMAVALGQGPAIKVKDSGMLAHPGVKQLLVEAAKALGIPYQLEVLVGGTTDAMAMQVSRSGVPAGVVSIPTRYVHSPSEMVDASDVQNAVKLLLKVLANPVVLPA
jgi:endoglucanase